MKKGVLVYLAIPLLAAVAGVAHPDEGRNDLPVLETRPVTAAVFKNGLGFVVREGEARLADGWGIIEDVPPASLGTLWLATTGKRARIEQAVGLLEDVEQETSSITIPELLRANVGRQAVIHWGEDTIEGVIKHVPDEREPDSPETDRRRRANVYLPPERPSMVMIQTEDGCIEALQLGSISRIELPEASSVFTKKVKKPRIKFKVAGAEDSERIALAYLRKGLSWVPSYLVDIGDEKKARITLQALVINDAEDLVDAELVLVVGVPTFAFADTLSPMSMQQSLAEFLAALAGGSEERYRASMMTQSFLNVPMEAAERGFGGMGGGGGRHPDYSVDAPKALGGVFEEDLFLYRKPGVTLAEGQRAYLAVFQDDVEYEHKYTWEVPDTANINIMGYFEDRQRQESPDVVWHSVALTNSTKYPWTTGPAFVTSAWRPLAQNQLNYTQKGSETDLKLTIASDVSVRKTERETARQRDALKIAHNLFTKISVEGTLTVKNYKTRSIELEVKKLITGEVAETGPKAEVEKLGSSLFAVNPRSEIVWHVKLGAGEEKDLIYTYDVLMRV